VAWNHSATAGAGFWQIDLDLARTPLDLFHSFYYTDLGKAVSYLAITMPLAFVAQRTKSTWPGFILHYIINIGFPIIVARGVLGL